MSTSIFETPAFDLPDLDEEHAKICRRFEELDEVILRPGSMHSIHGILAAADNLVHMILLHFTHEEQVLVKLSRHSLQNRQRETKTKIVKQLSGIRAELEQGKIAAVFQLLRLSKVWIEEHIRPASEGGERERLSKKRSRFSVRCALVDHPAAITGNTASHDHPSHRLWHAQGRVQRSLQAAPEHNG